jgi:hypothetical protein
MADHLLDEGRHSGFWARMVRIYWHTASEGDRQCIAQILPVFIGHYLTNDIQKSFDLRLIDALQISDTARHALRREVSGLAFPINRHHPLVTNIVRFFHSSSLLDSPCVQRALSDYLI